MANFTYAVGDWSLTSNIDDSTNTSSVTVPDIDYATEYATSCGDCSEQKLVGIVGNGLRPEETLRYARTVISDVYKDSDIPSIQRAEVKSGVRTLCEVRVTLTATNSKTGAILQFPLKAWVCAQLPTASLITAEAANFVVKYAIGACFAHGESSDTLIPSVARGDLNPST